jgi:uncharacterized protein YndB with AHSA1/START domain
MWVSLGEWKEPGMKTIQQKIKFNAPPKVLYELYMDSEKHGLATGAKAKAGRGIGGSFSAHDGYVSGKNLQLVPGRLIVQTWRGADWDEAEPDSILFLSFEEIPGGGEVRLVHAGLSPKNAERHAIGWRTHYWNRWKSYLERRAVGSRG